MNGIHYKSIIFNNHNTHIFMRHFQTPKLKKLYIHTLSSLISPISELKKALFNLIIAVFTDIL